jgi:hypothetical protein
MGALEGLPMRRLLRQSVTMLAIYAIALHILLLGFAPFVASAAGIDPFTVICHSTAGGPGDEAPAKSGFVPGSACEHCNLCGAVAAPPPPGVAIAIELAPALVLDVLDPVSAAPQIGTRSDPKLARGPPHFV